MKMTSLGKWFVVIVLAWTGCATLQDVSSGEIGCPANDIAISDDEQGWGTRKWTAECDGRIFYCSALGGGRGAPHVACKERLERRTRQSPPAAPPAPAGCRYDTQCKGDRVCQDGRCVGAAPARGPAPPPAPPAPAVD